MKLGKVVMTGNPRPDADRWIREHCEVKSWDEPGALPRELLLQWIEDAEGLMSVGTQPVKVDAELLARAGKLKVISQSSVGYDNVDVSACTARGIPFGNTPGVLTEATADLAFLLLMCAARRIKESSAIVQVGEWTPLTEIPLGVDLYGKTLGRLVWGRLGRQLLAVPNPAHEDYYHNRRRRAPEEEWSNLHWFLELLEQSDFIVVLIPLSIDRAGYWPFGLCKDEKNRVFY